MTAQEFDIKMNQRLKELQEAKPMVLAITTTLSDYVPRIFEQGLNSRNMTIGTYSTKPIYVSNNQASTPRSIAPTKGKTGKSVFKNGKPHKSRYFSSGYKQFKGVIGRGTKVNLRLFGELRSDVAAQRLRKVTGGYDFYIKKDINAKKIEGLTKHFGNTPIFNLTRKEFEKYKKILTAEVLSILTK